ncbi:hypothetical protein [Pseudanabaena sp. PCC 6802]|uniref:hypothetical protein n=1 Tax=Pseudanabaena sp. PCC 6802 TaxID=118173 RepID=UPI00034B87EE|nr:hypothetical protein [Pseudanabaena sp. PCC 6802]
MLIIAIAAYCSSCQTQLPELFQGSDLLPTMAEIELELTADRIFGWLKMAD